MSLLETIESLATAGGLSGKSEYTVTRTTVGTMTDGVYVRDGTVSTFPITAIIQPATGMQRVVGGMDMRSDERGEHTDDVRQLYTEAFLHGRLSTHDPDVVTITGTADSDGDWTVFRAEPWELSGQIFYRVVITRRTLGAAP